jgi:hypothetical protein
MKIVPQQDNTEKGAAQVRAFRDRICIAGDCTGEKDRERGCSARLVRRAYEWTSGGMSAAGHSRKATALPR